MLLGLVLYGFLSPVTQSAFVDMAAAMRAAPVRFFAVEHPVGMIVAIALAHVGRVRIRKATDSESRHKRALVFFGLALAGAAAVDAVADRSRRPVALPRPVMEVAAHR